VLDREELLQELLLYTEVAAPHDLFAKENRASISTSSVSFARMPFFLS
jgi:hypothetical protein